MAKFKVGDKVKVKGAGVETIKAVYPKGKGSGLDSTQVDMSVDWYETNGSGMIADEDIVGIANSRACNSTNPVVANAMRASGGVARNANDWIDDPKKKKAMDEIDKKADALYRQLKDIARKFDALKNEQVKVGFYFADYSDAARQIREIHGME